MRTRQQIQNRIEQLEKELEFFNIDFDALEYTQHNSCHPVMNQHELENIKHNMARRAHDVNMTLLALREFVKIHR